MATQRLDAQLIEQMLRLYRRYYCHVVRRTFLADLSSKGWAIILRDGKKLAGFSTLQVFRLRVAGRACRVVFSGDTIVAQAYRQSPALAGSFVHFVSRLLAQPNAVPLYWFLISKGYRTYRYLPVFFHRFYPNYWRPIPAASQRLLAAIARHKFGPAYDPSSGIIKFSGARDWLRPPFSAVPVARARDPHVAIFLQRNPGHARGDELACLTPLTRTNLNRVAWRVHAQTAVSWVE